MKGKLGYGLKNFLLGWTAMFIEPYQPRYGKPIEGFCVGIAQTVVYTANGLVHIATFPIPMDFPDVGRGIHIPEVEKKYGHKTKPAAAQPAPAPVLPAEPAAETQLALPSAIVPAPPVPSPAESEPLTDADAEKEAAIFEALETASAKTVVGPDEPAAFPDEEELAADSNQNQ